ncbi:winged helix-turn-helix domain-containing protein [Novosphingobium kaempferiae]|uniref:winged helix-turn-helix domain-containing protein n=1 Tax=Novosphingobium kaempferiae TaxID=2896849 RepID=UPI001E37386B|nr:winged helix-turn-helix domain-containing protein [Novosphingobium kaempferiae]
MGSLNDMKVVQAQPAGAALELSTGLTFRNIRSPAQSAVPDQRTAANDAAIDAGLPANTLTGNARSNSGSIRLGALEVHPRARTVAIDGGRVDLGGRAFDLLMVLIEAAGQIVSKEELLRRVWPTVTIIESNLKVQLSLLRRALGPERWRIKTVSGRGYLLITDDAEVAAPATGQVRAAPSHPFVIVVDVDPNTQNVLVSAISEVARQFDALLSSPDLSTPHLVSLG